MMGGVAIRFLITDYAWPSLDEERRVLEPAGGELVVAETGEEDELVSLAGDVDAILTCWKLVTPAVLDAAAPRCRVVSRYGVGTDNIAVDHAAALGMAVVRVPDYCVEEVADHTMALLLASARHVAQFDRAVRSGVWDNAGAGFIPRLRGQTLALIGFGQIGKAVAERAAAFGLDVVAWTRSSAESLHDVLAAADYVSLHVPLTDETRGLIGATELAAMKPTAYLVNTSRGAVVDEQALVSALERGAIAGAALDVLTQEPAAPHNPLLRLDNALVTPHAAFYSEASTAEVARKAAQNALDVLQGRTPPAAYVVRTPGSRSRDPQSQA